MSRHPHALVQLLVLLLALTPVRSHRQVQFRQLHEPERFLLLRQQLLLSLVQLHLALVHLLSHTDQPQFRQWEF